MCYAQSVRELRSKAEGVPTKKSEGTGIRTLSPLKRLRQSPVYSPNRLVSQSSTLMEWSVQGCKSAHRKTNSLLDDRMVILTTTRAFHYLRARRDEIRFTFDLPGEWFFYIYILEPILHQIWTEVPSKTLRIFQTCFEDFDICNPVSIVLKWFEDF